jgi:hypothetical protein
MGSILNLFSPPAPELPPPPPLPPVPTEDDPEVQKRREQVRLAALQRKGRASTILTSGLGDTSLASLSRATLGGQ